MADVNDNVDRDGPAGGVGDVGNGAAADAAPDTGLIGETGSDVISGDIADPSGDSGRDIDADPDVAPIQGGDISETPAAHSGTRGSGTGADLGTGGEVGTTRPLQT